MIIPVHWGLFMSAIRSTGHCSCGAVRIKVTGPLRLVVYCHCSQCRRQTGHYLAATACDDDRLEIEGGEAISWYQSSDVAKRGFCSKCGSGLFWKHQDAAYTSILAGLFDEPNSLKQESHIFVGDKGCYYDLTDGLPQYQTVPDGLIVKEETKS